MSGEALHRLLCAVKRYFFVSAPPRAESLNKISESTTQLQSAVSRLEVELNLLEGRVRPTPEERQRA
jgi:hypothetical protein